MTRHLRLWAAVVSGLLPALGWAQCPTAASCTPGAASASSNLTTIYRMGIYTVTLGSINNTTPGYTDGYKDYSCTTAGTTNLTVGTPAVIKIVNGTVASENVRVWVDYNNNGTFGTDELAYSSDNKMTHSGTFTPPTTAVLGTRLRLRIASDYYLGTIPTACSTPQYSQTEDYGVTLVANSSPPVAAFTASATTTCTGCVQFTDQSVNAPTSWLWDFGDNTTSTQQNPQHCYTMAGTYQVKLTATNTAGSNASATTAITYNTSVPVALATGCAGLSASTYCCNYGITQVKLGTLTNASADGSAGYQNFTCTQRVTLMAGTAYTLSVTTGGTNAHDTRAWLDLNNDGAFTSNEKVFEALSTVSPSASITLPGSAVQGQPLRLRIVADGVGTNPQPCSAPTLGQTEDYTVTVTPNTNPPAAAFTSNYVAGECVVNKTYTFTDQSTNAPTAWQWTFSPSTGVAFVNGTSATSQNPQVTFSASGYYSVTLRASNANGASSAVKPNYVLAQIPCTTYCAAAGGFQNGTLISAGGYWITNVAVTAGAGGSAYSNASGNSTTTGSIGYSYYASAPVSLTPGGTQTITVTTNVATTHRTTIWIDYNRDGAFTGTGELVYNGVATGAAAATASIAVPTTLGITRMRVLVAIDNNTPNPCALYYGQGEVEDYVVTPTVLASRQALALPALSISPNPTADGALQVQVDEPGASGRYEVVVENALGAQLLRQSLRLSPAAPAALSLAELPAGLYLVRLTNEQGQTALRRIVRQ